ACHVIAKRLAGCRIARGAGVAEDFGRSCRSSNKIVARSKTRGQVLRECPAENCLLQAAPATACTLVSPATKRVQKAARGRGFIVSNGPQFAPIMRRPIRGH